MYLEKYNLSGKIAVVTGAAGGIGLPCCQALAEAGAKVVVADSEHGLAQAACDDLAGKGFVSVPLVFDVTKPEQIEAAASRVEMEHGAVDILVCCAGIARSGVAAEDVTDPHWRDVIDVNLNGVFWCCRSFGKRMLQRGQGAIVNIGSMSAFVVNKPQKQAFYNASKAGVHQLTRSLAAEWADRGVRVNAVAPTYIDTALTQFGMQDDALYSVWLENTPMRRIGQPHEIASVVLFLASDASSLMTGSIVVADAGYSCW